MSGASGASRVRRKRRLILRERLILAVTEEIIRNMQMKRVTKSDLSHRLGVTKGAVSQMLSGEFPGSVILAHAERALIVALDGQIVEPERRWCAIGSGRAIASGAIHHALNADDWKADEVAIAGVEAACAMDNGCGLPIKHYWT